MDTRYKKINVSRKIIHLVCNAHLDPVWLWQWEDGLTEALSTFRVACDFCENEREFIFCHNEAALYEWVEEHEPGLFARIKKMVRAGRWHIAGGSYLQPDINLPSGESHIRQFLVGRTYFKDKFGVEPKTAYNFDSFGQPEGYVQLLSGCGYDSYIFTRPHEWLWHLSRRTFRWKDRSGNEVLACRPDSYGTNSIPAYTKLQQWMAKNAGKPDAVFLWGIGNHGGGPSRRDWEGIKKYAREHRQFKLIHSTPEAYFRFVKKHGEILPVVTGEIERIHQGCYTSMARLKRAHRLNENLMSATERMATMAWWLNKSEYPAKELAAAWRDILFTEFHDVLAGSSIQSVEKDSLIQMGHCTEILCRIKLKTFIRLIHGEPAAGKETVPVFVWNPHGYEIAVDLECNFNYSHYFAKYGEIELAVRDAVTHEKMLFQQEASESAVANDWRMKIVVPVELKPFAMRRIEVTWRKRRRKKIWREPENISPLLEFRNKFLYIRLNPRTGLLDFAAPVSNKTNFLKQNALQPVVFRDIDHAWNCGGPGRTKEAEKYRLGMAPWEEPLARFSLVKGRKLKTILSPPSLRSEIGDSGKRLNPLHVVEEGPVRTVFEAVFAARQSVIIRRYILPRQRNWIEIHDRIYWNEKDAILKITLPLGFRAANTVAEAPYSAIIRPVPRFHVDFVNQRWVAATEGTAPEGTGGRFVAVANDSSYAHSIFNNTLYVNAMRSPAYSSYRLQANLDVHELRYWPRQDQGEHEIRFRILFGRHFSETTVSRAAQSMNIPPEWLVYYPAGSENAGQSTSRDKPFISVTGEGVQIAALKKEEKGNGMVVRLWNLTPERKEIVLKVADPAYLIPTTIAPYGLKTLAIRKQQGRLVTKETNLVEKHV
jgi:alpha-mannosidase